MTPDRWRQIEALFQTAQNCDPKERVALLDRADPEIRSVVQRMLEQSSGSRLLDPPVANHLDDSGRTRLAPGTQLGPYRIQAQIGSGGMGMVFRAVDTRLDRVVAIKIAAERYSERFQIEARVISTLNHPHICTLYDVGPDYLVMEFIEGPTLADEIAKGPMGPEGVVRCGAQIAAALAEAHAHGIIHRDLKPGNVMVTRHGVKVLDFGLARMASHAGITETNAIMGTPAYMAPEQIHGRECDARTDIYALGLVLAEMATGKRTIPGGRPQLDSLPEKLGHVTERCLAENPEDRWQTARDVKAELEWAAKATPAAVLPASGRPSRSRLLLLGAAVAALAILAGLAFVRFHNPPVERQLRYGAILPPRSASFEFATNGGPMALSPDGRSMVFSATAADGTSQLWLRSLSKPDAQPLQGTQNGRFPFWSPDSRWVGFFSDGMLRKIDTRGGSPVSLAEAKGGGNGGSWSRGNVIVFAPGQYFPLEKVSAEGGATGSVIAEDVAMGTAHGFPWFLPDGDHFVFVSWGGTGHMNLRVGSLSSAATRLIGETDSNAAYSEGHLLFLRDDSLVARAFDPKSLLGDGEPAAVAEHVERFGNLIGTGAFSISATGLLAYQTGGNRDLRQLTWFDRDGRRSGTVGEPRVFFDIEFSPDRRNLLASFPDAVGNYDLWMYDMARGLPSRFTFDPAGEYWAVWSADGKTVIFNSTKKGHYDLYRKPAAGGGAEELVYADDTDKVPTSWSPDGRYVLYFTGGGPHFDMWELPLTPRRPGTALMASPMVPPHFNEKHARFSPDQGWVVYDSDESGRSEIYVAPFPRPSEKYRISAGGGTLPRWGHDGREIFYQALDGQVMVAGVHINAGSVEVGSVRMVFAKTTLTGGYSYDVTTDGQRILAATPVQTQASAEPVTLVDNWTALLPH